MKVEIPSGFKARRLREDHVPGYASWEISLPSVSGVEATLGPSAAVPGRWYGYVDMWSDRKTPTVALNATLPSEDAAIEWAIATLVALRMQ